VFCFEMFFSEPTCPQAPPHSRSAHRPPRATAAARGLGVGRRVCVCADVWACAALSHVDRDPAARRRPQGEPAPLFSRARPESGGALGVWLRSRRRARRGRHRGAGCVFVSCADGGGARQRSCAWCGMRRWRTRSRMTCTSASRPSSGSLSSSKSRCASCVGGAGRVTCAGPPGS